MDAQIGQVYWAWFEVTKGGLIELRAPSVASPTEVTGPNGEPFSQVAPGFVILGDGSGLVSDAHDAITMRDIFAEARPRPSNTALAFLDQIDQSLLLQASQLEPRYVQKEISWKKLSEQGKAGKGIAEQGRGP